MPDGLAAHIREWAEAEKVTHPDTSTAQTYKKLSEGIAAMIGAEPTKEGMISSALRTWAVVKDVLPSGEEIEIVDTLRAHIRSFSLETGELLDDARARIEAVARALGPDTTIYRGLPHDELLRRMAQLDAYLEEADDSNLKLAMLRDTILFGNMLATLDGQVVAVALARWADAAFPQIEVGHKYAAALMVTNATADVLERVRPPWPAFVIEVPTDLLMIRDTGKDRDLSLRRLLVTTTRFPDGSNRWSFVGLTDTSLSVWRFGVTTVQLLEPTVEHALDREELLPLTENDDRVLTLAGRLIIATCLAMSDPSNVQEVGIGHQEHAAARKHGRRFGRPIVRTFKVGKPIKLDLRPRIQEYVKSGLGGRKLTVQSLVCGHFKGQHHGPQNSLYKIIWREPFWRGPEEAPILVRPHTVKEPE
jgi:hypothetical protein